MAQKASSTQDYVLGKQLGRGGFGSVFEGTMSGKKPVAIKVIQLDDESQDVSKIISEIRTLSSSKLSRYLMSYHDAVVKGTELWIVMELMDKGSVANHAPLPEAAIASVARDVLLGLQELGKDNIIHRDIKGANILLNSQGDIKLGDFGATRVLSKTFANTLTGTPHWMCPEALKSKPQYNSKADIWALGVTCYEMAVGVPPHANTPVALLPVKIVQGPAPTLPAGFSKKFTHFVSACLNKDPDQRPTVEHALKHPFLKKAVSNSDFAGLLFGGSTDSKTSAAEQKAPS